MLVGKWFIHEHDNTDAFDTTNANPLVVSQVLFPWTKQLEVGKKKQNNVFPETSASQAKLPPSSGEAGNSGTCNRFVQGLWEGSSPLGNAHWNSKPPNWIIHQPFTNQSGWDTWIIHCLRHEVISLKASVNVNYHTWNMRIPKAQSSLLNYRHWDESMWDCHEIHPDLMDIQLP